MDDTSSKGSAHGNECGTYEQGAPAHLRRVTISSRRSQDDSGCLREKKLSYLNAWRRGRVAEGGGLLNHPARANEKRTNSIAIGLSSRSACAAWHSLRPRMCHQRPRPRSLAKPNDRRIDCVE